MVLKLKIIFFEVLSWLPWLWSKQKQYYIRWSELLRISHQALSKNCHQAVLSHLAIVAFPGTPWILRRAKPKGSPLPVFGNTPPIFTEISWNQQLWAQISLGCEPHKNSWRCWNRFDSWLCFRGDGCVASNWRPLWQCSSRYTKGSNKCHQSWCNTNNNHLFLNRLMRKRGKRKF